MGYTAPTRPLTGGRADSYRLRAKSTAARFGFGQMAAVMGRRLARNALEHAIEVSERPEANFLGDLANGQVWIQQKVPGPLGARPGDEFRKIDSRHFFEQFAEIKRAGVDGGCHPPEGQA